MGGREGGKKGTMGSYGREKGTMEYEEYLWEGVMRGKEKDMCTKERLY